MLSCGGLGVEPSPPHSCRANPVPPFVSMDGLAAAPRMPIVAPWATARAGRNLAVAGECSGARCAVMAHDAVGEPACRPEPPDEISELRGARPRVRILLA